MHAIRMSIVVLSIVSAPTAAAEQAAEQPEAAEVRVRPMKLVERRTIFLEGEPPQVPKVSMIQLAPWNKLTLTLEAAGPPVARAVRYGHIQIDQAKLASGQSIEPSQSKGRNYLNVVKFVDINRSTMYRFRDRIPNDAIKFDVRLESPPRTAEAIAVVRGTFKLLLGPVEPVRIEYEQLVRPGEMVHDPVFRQAGLQVKVVDPSDYGGEENPHVAVRVIGDLKRVVSVQLLNGGGENISARHTSYLGLIERPPTHGMRTHTFIIHEDLNELPDDARVVIRVLTDRRELTVPFEVRDMELP